MLKHFLLASAAASALFASPLAAQGRSAPTIGLTPYAGYMKFGNIISGPLGTGLRNAGSAVYGGELSLGLTRNIALVGNLAYSRPGLEIGAPLVGGLSVGESSVWLYDAGLRLSLPGAGALPIAPFIQGGAGGVRQKFDLGPLSTHSTSFAYNVGAGADVALSRRLGLELMVKDYIGKFDTREATGMNLDSKTTHNWAVSGGLRLGL
jgi:opacity protein-like surface antigen